MSTRPKVGTMQAALSQAIAAAGGQATSAAVSRFRQVRVAALLELAEGLDELDQRLGAAAEGDTVTDQTAFPASREHVP